MSLFWTAFKSNKQDTKKEDTMNTQTIDAQPVTPIGDQMAAMHAIAGTMPGESIEDFIERVKGEKSQGDLVQTEADVGGTPL